MKTDIGKTIERIRKRLGIPLGGERKPLTEEERRKRARLVVYPLFVLLFAGCIWLIYSPTQKEREDAVQGGGFNTDIPSPENRKMQGNKVDAYEEAELARKEKQRRGTFQEMVSLFDREGRDTVRLPEAFAETPPEGTSVTADAPRSSVEAYRHISRTLDNLYVSDTRDPKKEELERRIEELERQRTAPEPAGNTMEEKMALMEKSYELAARYGGRQPRQIRPAQDERERRAARPVRRMQSRAVSSLSRPSGNGEAAVFSGERNTGFHTPVGKTLTSERNTIEACVHGTQTVSDGRRCASGCWNRWWWMTVSFRKVRCLWAVHVSRGSGWTFWSPLWNIRVRCFRWNWKCMTPTGSRVSSYRTRWSMMRSARLPPIWEAP